MNRIEIEALQEKCELLEKENKLLKDYLRYTGEDIKKIFESKNYNKSDIPIKKTELSNSIKVEESSKKSIKTNKK